MSKIRDQVLKANADYQKSFGQLGKLALPPAREFAILTCMDARIDPAKLAGLHEHELRNGAAVIDKDLHQFFEGLAPLCWQGSEPPASAAFACA